MLRSLMLLMKIRESMLDIHHVETTVLSIMNMLYSTWTRLKFLSTIVISCCFRVDQP